MYLLGMDTETTGLDLNRDVITEFCGVLWHWETQRPVYTFSGIHQNGAMLTPNITKLTGITPQHIQDGLRRDQMLYSIQLAWCRADYIVAHNAPFDHGFMMKEYPELPDKPWIDTATDVDYDMAKSARSLAVLCYEHGITNPLPHAALGDVLAMMSLLSRYELTSVLANQASEKIDVIADVTFDEKDLAKAAGFRWVDETKTWEKNIRENQLTELQQSCSFPVSVRNR